MATCIAEKARGADHAYRYGGEEILLILPETQAENGLRAAERTVNEVRALAIPHTESPWAAVTVSCGVGSVGGRSNRWPDWQSLVREIDVALYRAKQEGRNRAISIDVPR